MKVPPCGGSDANPHAKLAALRSPPERVLKTRTRSSMLILTLGFLVIPISHETFASRPRKPLLFDDLTEGRLDSNLLCGTRYPSVLKYRQLGQALDSGSNNNNDNNSDNDNNLLYIVGGDEVEDDQFWPWSVAIYELDPLNGQRGFICSGSLISDRFVLTAAHCIQQSRFDTLSSDEIFLKIASTRLDDERVRFYTVEKVFVHPEYSVNRKANDIALLKLERGQKLPTRARPICLPSQMANRIDFTDQPVTIIGWGKTDAMNGNEPTRLIDSSQDAQSSFYEDKSVPSQTNETLLQAQVRVTSLDQCNRSYSKLDISWLNIDEHFICASDPFGKRDACQGDSGGPLMWNNQQGVMEEQLSSEKWYQLGLVSFGHGCANTEYPGVYTRISYYMPWILKIVNGRKSFKLGK